MSRRIETLVLAVAAVTCAAMGTAAADTIYLRNGRVIHTASARVEDGRVHFTQFGGAVSIPLAEVARIVDDDTVEKTGADRTGVAGVDEPVATPVAPADPGTEPRATTPGDDPPAAGAGEDEHSPDQPEYWIERIRAVDDRIARVQSELDRLPCYDEVDRRLLRFSGQALYFIAERERWQKLMNQLELSRQRLFHGARKAGITPGSLRKGLRQ